MRDTEHLTTAAEGAELLRDALHDASRREGYENGRLMPSAQTRIDERRQLAQVEDQVLVVLKGKQNRLWVRLSRVPFRPTRHMLEGAMSKLGQSGARSDSDFGLRHVHEPPGLILTHAEHELAGKVALEPRDRRLSKAAWHGAHSLEVQTG